MNASVPKILIHANPRTGLEAKFSGEFAAAAALVEERLGIQTFTDAKVQDPAIRALLPRVRVSVDPEIPGDLERLFPICTPGASDSASSAILRAVRGDLLCCCGSPRLRAPPRETHCATDLGTACFTSRD